VVLSPGRFLWDTAGTAERWAMISSALKPFLMCWGNFLAIVLSRLMSTVKMSSDFFSAATPLYTIVRDAD
jgi:hypothetical protein